MRKKIYELLSHFKQFIKFPKPLVNANYRLALTREKMNYYKKLIVSNPDNKAFYMLKIKILKDIERYLMETERND